MFSKSLARAGLIASVVITTVNAIATISTTGSKFFTSDGDQFFIKGVAYQLTEADPLIDTKQCQLDASLMKTLGANAIRVYHVDPSGDHSGCMSAFADAGVYLFLDLDTFNTAITPTDATWDQSQYTAFGKVMDAFAKYDNTLGNSKGYREIPIGYSAADIAELRPMLQNYLACGANTSEAIDFFGLNAYEWCGNNQAAILGPEMDDQWSGAIVYEWIEEANDYGLISYGSTVAATVVASGVAGGYSRAGTPTPVSPDFANLQSQWSTLTPTGVASSAYSPTLTPPACPASTSGGWLVDGDVKLPSIGQKEVTGTATTTSGSISSTGSATGSAASATSTKKG
ncbi:hypothetical protein EYC84_004072 [Monilinia fructicola]|uniref:1,3-beta-glucanosyltransferase n=1 Tax=Monilinia fructicola TaxID=38448 RepID=A0A5M9K1X4_MONFR|nr:hypothetical protein EYC84_004072 [Monilinia fructicola]